VILYSRFQLQFYNYMKSKFILNLFTLNFQNACLKYHFYHLDLGAPCCNFSSSSAYISVAVSTVNEAEER